VFGFKGVIKSCLKQEKKMSKFHEYPGASFSEDDVENYLEELAEKGWGVFKRHNSYVIVIEDERKITTSFSSYYKTWGVNASYMEGKLPFDSTYDIVNFQQFKVCFAKAAEYLGEDLNCGPASIRLKEVTPASNKRSLARLAHNNVVNCIFDPYFDDKSITILITLINLGMLLNKDVRVLTTSKSRGRLSMQMISDFKIEKGVNLDIRLCSSDKEHRRYLLLSTGDALVIGCSLNAIDKNEAAHMENSQEDRDFFETQWSASLPL
jgi:hypothetical protein